MSNIHATEHEEFQNVCKRLGFNSQEFDLKEILVSPNSFNSELFITRKSNGIRKLYQVGNGTKWSAEFEIDLESFIFGVP